MPNDSATYRLFSLDYFDSVLLTGDYQADDIRFLETLRHTKRKELVTAGCTYLDVYAEKMKNFYSSAPAGSEEKKFTVLVSPSWGPSGLLQRYGERLLDPLVKTGKNVIIRPHPQSKKSESETLNRLAGLYGDCPSVEWDFEAENIRSLSRSDIMISDFSGIIFDYIFLCDKPVIYAGADMDLRPYDASDLDHEMWQMKTLREIGIELKEDDFPKIGEVIDRAANSVSLKEARQRAKQTAWQYPGEAGKRAADFMISKLVDTNNKNG
jgi:CDP-glycerol glycerophosphotransferase (TagB/SpsB family)